MRVSRDTAKTIVEWLTAKGLALEKIAKDNKENSALFNRALVEIHLCRVLVGDVERALSHNEDDDTVELD